MGDIQAARSHHLIGGELVENVVVAHPSDGEAVVDVASHATEEREEEVSYGSERDGRKVGPRSPSLLDIWHCTVGTRPVEVAVHQSGDEVRRHADDQPVCDDSQDADGLQHVYPHAWRGETMTEHTGVTRGSG